MAFEKELEKKAVEIAEKVGEETAKIESEAKEVEEKVLEETVEVIEKVENKMDKLVKELAHKNKTQGLTDEELKERDVLRKEYIAEFKRGMKKNIMDNLYIMDKDGNKVKVEPKAYRKQFPTTSRF